jgi:AcrR family transcriptional regulator
VPTNVEKSDATREALVRAARELFADRGYAETSIEQLARAAKVTRGALYYHFGAKEELFRAVYRELGRELAEKAAAAAQEDPRPERHLEIGVQALLDAFLDPAVQRIVLVDAPSVLGARATQDVDVEYGLDLLATALSAAMEAGYIDPGPVEPLAHALIGALRESGLVIARSTDPVRARAEMGTTVGRLIDGLRTSGTG